jgi:hypothetical protein
MAFELLADVQGGANLQIRDSDVEVAAGKVLHALEGSKRELLIPLGENEPEHTDEASRGVVLRPRSLMDGKELRRFQAVECLLPALNEPFESLCDEILELLTTQPDNPGFGCAETLDRWRELLGAAPSRLLGENAIMGLLAELHFLERLVRAHGAAAALRCWTGPGGARFDFIGPAGDVEVKATAVRDTFTVTIHGLLQLEPAGSRPLHLYAEQVERVPSGGDSVPEAVDRLVTAGVSRHDLLERLRDAGCAVTDLPTYQGIRFAGLAHRGYLITSTFPRLVTSGLVDPGMADRIQKVQYAIDIGDTAATPGHFEDIDGIAEGIVAT